MCRKKKGKKEMTKTGRKKKGRNTVKKI